MYSIVYICIICFTSKTREEKQERKEICFSIKHLLYKMCVKARSSCICNVKYLLCFLLHKQGSN